MNQVIKSTILLASLTGLFVFIGNLLGGQKGMFIALGFAAITNIGTYWFSDKVVLKMQGAKPLNENQYPAIARSIRELADQAKIPVPKAYIVETPIPNAFATGRSPKHAAVAVHTGIIDLLTENELRAVLAHELGHVKNRDILVSTIAATAAGAIGVLAQIAQFGGMFFAGGSQEEDRPNPIALLVTIILAPLAATLIQLAISRSREFYADEYGAHLVHGGDDLANALLKLENFKQGHTIPAASSFQQATSHLMFANMFSAGGLASLFSTHPSTADRVKRLKGLR